MNVSFNVTEWLASPGGTKFLKLIEEMSKEELNVCLTVGAVVAQVASVCFDFPLILVARTLNTRKTEH